MPILMGDHIGAYSLDCKGGVVALIMLARRLLQAQPLHDVYLAATREEEEIGCVGALYVADHIPAETMVALEIGVTGQEFGVENTADPVIYYSGGDVP